MATGEKYIERLQRERAELVTYIKAELSWEEALHIAHTTGRKGSAFQEVERRLNRKKELFKTIEPLLAD